MSEELQGTAQTPNDAQTSTEAGATTLLTGDDGASTTQQEGNQAEGQTTAAAGETKTEETKTAEGAPESYDFKAPEGKAYDPAVLTSFSEAAKELNLTQDAAQKFIDKMAPVLATRQADQIKAVQDGWLAASKDDKEFGGADLQKNLGIANKALNTFAPKNADGSKSPLVQLLETTGLSNNPDVIRFMVRVGKAISEDGFVRGGAPGGDKRIQDVLYDNTGAK